MTELKVAATAVTYPREWKLLAADSESMEWSQQHSAPPRAPWLRPPIRVRTRLLRASRNSRHRGGTQLTESPELPGRFTAR